MAISPNDDKSDNTDKNQQTRVVSTKIPVDQYDSFNLLVEYLSKTGVIETSTPSALLRNSITQLLNTYRNDIENYRIAKKQSTANNNDHRLGNIERNQILGNEQLHPSANNDGRIYPQGMNSTLAKGSEYSQEKVQVHNNQNQPSCIRSTQEDLKEPQQEMQFLRNSEQPRAEDPISNLYELDIAKYMYTLVMIDRQSKIKTVYLEVNETTKEVIHIIPSYGLENWKKRQQKI